MSVLSFTEMPSCWDEERRWVETACTRTIYISMELNLKPVTRNHSGPQVVKDREHLLNLHQTNETLDE